MDNIIPVIVIAGIVFFIVQYVLLIIFISNNAFKTKKEVKIMLIPYFAYLYAIIEGTKEIIKKYKSLE